MAACIKVATLSQQLCWSHFVELLPIQDDLKREFYATLCVNEGLGFIRGDAKATKKVCLEYKNLLYFAIATYVGNKEDADDVLSAAFLKVMERMKTLKDPKKMKSFLCASTRTRLVVLVEAQFVIEIQRLKIASRHQFA